MSHKHRQLHLLVIPCGNLTLDELLAQHIALHHWLDGPFFLNMEALYYHESQIPGPP